MSRYIDADALIDNFAELTVDLWLDSVEEAEIVSLIGNSPSIDIVRCKECKRWGTEDCFMCNECQRNPYPTNPDDFCSYGEVRDEFHR